MTDVLSWTAAALAAVAAALSWRIHGSARDLQRRLEEVSENLARTAVRLEKLEMTIEQYWRGVESRMGKMQEMFESGRACRMGGTVAEVDLKMGHLNRKMDTLLERRPRSEPIPEAP